MRMKTPSFDFMVARKITGWISIGAVIGSVALLALIGLSFGLDFTGGTAVEVGFSQPADLKKIRSVLTENGFDDASVQLFGTSKDVLVRLAPRGDDVKAEV